MRKGFTARDYTEVVDKTYELMFYNNYSRRELFDYWRRNGIFYSMSAIDKIVTKVKKIHAETSQEEPELIDIALKSMSRQALQVKAYRMMQRIEQNLKIVYQQGELIAGLARELKLLEIVTKHIYNKSELETSGALEVHIITNNE